MKTIIAIAIFLLSGSALAVPNPPAAGSIPTRTSGKIPLCVQFNAAATMGTTYAFHDYLYVWNFGDSSAGPSSYGVGALQKNFATGPVATHCYETAGTYTWSLSVSDGTSGGTIFRTSTITASAWANDATTFCLTTGSDFTGCPSNATQVGSVSALHTSVASNIGSGNVRFLLRKGDTFTLTADIAINQSTVAFAAYGSGAAPIITTSTADLHYFAFSGSSKSDFTISGIDFTNTNKANPPHGFVFSTAYNKVSIVNVTMTDMGRGVQVDNGIMGGYQHELAISGLTFSRTLFGKGTSSGNQPIYAAGVYEFSLLASSINAGEYGEHAVRIMKCENCVIRNNDILGPAPTKEALTLRANPRNTGAVDDTVYMVMSGNKFTGGTYNDGSNTNPWIVSFIPEGGGVSERDERIINAIFEGNLLMSAGGTSVGSQTGMMMVVYSKVSVRNNVADMSFGKARQGFQLATNADMTPDLVWFYNNTVYSSATDNDFGVIDVAAAVTNVTAKNNLGYAPNDSQHYGISCAGSSNLAGCAGLTASNNSLTTTAGGNGVLVDPLFTAPTSPPQGFAISTSSYADNGGTATGTYPAIISDFNNCWDKDGEARIGAFVPRADAICVGAP